MNKRILMVVLMVVMSVVSISSASTVYMVDGCTIIPPGETGSVDVRVSGNDEVLAWQTNITFDPTRVNITNVSFENTLFPDWSAWYNHGSYISIAGSALNGSESGNLAVLTVESKTECIAELCFTGEDNVTRLVSGENGTINTLWVNGTITSVQNTYTDVYLTPIDLSGDSDVMHVRINTTGCPNSLNSYIEYNSSCISITDIEIDDPDWWLVVQPTYDEGIVYFSLMRWGFPTGDFNVLNMTVTCANDYACESAINFSDDGNPMGQGVRGCNLGDITWTDGVANCDDAFGMCGDVNCDGIISIEDVIDAYFRVIHPSYPLGSEWAADVNGDGIISIEDVIDIYFRVIDPSYGLNCMME